MKLTRKKSIQKDKHVHHPEPVPWKVLIVDDEEDIHSLTLMSLQRMEFDGHKLTFLSAMSGLEARKVLNENPDIAVAFVDVVMESDNAGLELVQYIRNELKNKYIRLIVRTGQPGAAPEREVIDHYDIDDYKDKTELTSQKLYTTMRSALKAYRDLMIIENNRQGLERILMATPGLYLPHFNDIDEFFRGVLTQIVGLCHLGENGVLATVDGFISTVDQSDVQVLAGIGKFSALDTENNQTVVNTCSRIALEEDKLKPEVLPDGSLLLKLEAQNKILGFIYLENTQHLSEDDLHLLQILVNQCTSALENLKLHLDLKEANQESLYMLAIAAEFKDKATGDHIRRLAEYTRLLALEMGLSEEEADLYGQASMLHDIGKLGIPDEILEKPGPLTKEERAVIETHPMIGAHILDQHNWFQLAKAIALGHHERWDGQGYPLGLKGEKIPLVTRIVSVVDVFDALSHTRPYKEAWPLEKAVEVIHAGAGSQFDVAVVDAFQSLLDRGVFPLRD